MAADLVKGGETLGKLLASGPSGPLGAGRDRALRVLEVWRQAVGGGDPELFARRLSLDGLEEREALRRLARAFSQETAPPPRWLVSLSRAVPPKAAWLAVPGLLAAAARCRFQRFLGNGCEEGVAASLEVQLRENLAALAGRVPVSPWARAWDVFEDRPFLAKLLALRTDEWIRSLARLSRRFQRDRDALGGWFGGGPLVASEVTVGLSDRHQGDAVTRVTSGGHAVYYKPRSLQPEVALDGCFQALRAVGVALARQPRVLARRGYGWQEGVRRAAFSHRNEVERWFFAAGSLAAAAWVLGLTDLHWENVVAAEDGPVVVDGETWCLPLTVFQEGADPLGTILDSGLVTFPANGPSGVREDGALLGGSHPRASSLPLFGSDPPDPRAFREALSAGVRDALDKILQGFRNGQLRLPWDKLSRLQVRWVPRPSEAYAGFLTGLLENPKVREGWQVSVLVESALRPLLARGKPSSAVWRLARQEIQALEAFSIPRLQLPAGRRGGVVTVTGVERVRRRLETLSFEVTAEQVQLVARAVPRRGVGARDQGILDAARTVAAALAEGHAAERGGFFLRRGLAGEALAWAAWARASSDSLAFRKARERLGRLLEASENAAAHGPLGFTTGVGGMAYALAACGSLLQEKAGWKAARLVAARALSRPPEFALLDVEGGAAGLLLGVAPVASRFPELGPDLTRWGEVLARKAQDALGGNGGQGALGPGFAHGVSGVAAALVRVAAVTADSGLVRNAVGLLEGEPGAGRWLARAEVEGGGRVPVALSGWCHGPAGALLARLLVPEACRTPQLLGQIARARGLVFPLRLGWVSSLCCGTLARNEISLVFGELAGDQQAMDEAANVSVALFRSGAWQRGLPREGGLFDGLAGFLFHLARAHSPASVGSVLAAEVKGGESWS
ncbi:MAG: DUF4135 domain-containing protein [Thermoanaerobaculum sp.]